ncbi:AAA family ATPase [Candidatus Bathyarchaeota archaeon]|nr:AAA family ATPase [Candidatus Bathyarchaeota archaeon]NIU81616.1 AAA family ATPase [Candidatus Bathyarchaeota archaeon]NIV68261.1 AAA family ATPase [Candidatus Bathyarchaeota archaeon]NIW16602.1 AAA family ATPase [Candidatus Bathyarchaeota archaeon]NIW34802.1 AAA family ATPase [Candidatus Bathyarchaeota archaeon]
MKIAVSGKGGVGKTVVAGVLSDFLVKRGFEVLAVDADPAPNLALTLGISQDMASEIVPISENEDLIQSKTETGFEGVYRLTFKVGDIVEKFAVQSPYGVNLLVMGTIRSVGQGCTCPANAVVRTLLRHLFVARDEAVVVDMEAGVEHMGRGTARHVDIMLIVANPGMKSLETAKRIYNLATETGIDTIFLVGNKVADTRGEQSIREFTASNGIPLLELIPYDDLLLKADIRGETPLQYVEDSKSLRAIYRMGERLLEEAAK